MLQNKLQLHELNVSINTKMQNKDLIEHKGFKSLRSNAAWYTVGVRQCCRNKSAHKEITRVEMTRKRPSMLL